MATPLVMRSYVESLQEFLEFISDNKGGLFIKRGDVYLANLSPVLGSEQGGRRPVIILQNDIGNYFSPTVVVAAITARMDKLDLPVHVMIRKNEFGFYHDSIVLLEQIRTLDKCRLIDRIAHVDGEKMKEIDEALEISLGLREIEDSPFS